MAYHQQKKLLFIHIPKNAGKSIELALSLVSETLIARPRTRGRFNLVAKYILNQTQNKLMRQRLFGSYDYVLCAQHLTMQEIELLNLISLAEIKAASTFAVIRNPYSRALSTFRHFKKSTDLSDFKSFWREFLVYDGLDHNQIAHRRTQKSYVVDCRGKLAIDNLLRFESLNDDFEQFCRDHSLEHAGLPKLGAHDRLDYHDFYDSEARKLVESIFAEDIDEFKYVY